MQQNGNNIMASIASTVFQTVVIRLHTQISKLKQNPAHAVR